MSINTLILINVSPSVPLGLYIKAPSIHQAQYVVFYGKTVGRLEHKIIKRFFMVPDVKNKLYVYGTHALSLSSKHIGLIDIDDVVPMNKLVHTSGF